MSAEPGLTQNDYELLSAYLDDMLTAAERAELEARLQAEPHLRRELNALRGTVELVNRLPKLKAPRDFILTPAMLQSSGDSDAGQSASAPPRIIRFPLLSGLSAAAAAVMIFIGVWLIAAAGPPTFTAPADEIALLGTPAVQMDVAPAAAPDFPEMEEEAMEAMEALALDEIAEIEEAVEEADPGIGALALPESDDGVDLDTFDLDAAEDDDPGIGALALPESDDDGELEASSDDFADLGMMQDAPPDEMDDAPADPADQMRQFAPSEPLPDDITPPEIAPEQLTTMTMEQGPSTGTILGTVLVTLGLILALVALLLYDRARRKRTHG